MSKIYLKRKYQSKSWILACNKLGVDPKGIFIKGPRNDSFKGFCEIISLGGVALIGDDSRIKYWDCDLFEKLDDVAVMVLEAIKNKKGLS